jgi:hypothetical protein
MEDTLLKQARALYKDRLRIALAAFIVVFAISAYLFYSPEIITIGLEPIGLEPTGIAQGVAVVASVNTVGFVLAVGVMVLIFRFWQWAFLPGPASSYTLGILRGILGSKTTIKHTFGKRFRVTMESGLHFDVKCHIKEKDSGEWFVYRLISSPLDSDQLRSIALRHGFAVKNKRLVASVSNDELHHRTFLLTKAIMNATSSI